MRSALDESTSSASLAVLLGAYAIVYVVWGSTYLAIRIAVDTLPPLTLTGARLAAAGTILYVASRVWGGREQKSSVWEWAGSVAAGTLMLGAGLGGVTWAEQQVSSGVAALLAATIPLWFVVLEWTRTRERPSAAVAAGLVLGFGGIALLVGGGGSGDPVAADPLRAGVVLIGSALWAFGSVYGQSWPRPPSPVAAAAQQMLGAGVVLLILGWAVGERLDASVVSTASLGAWGYLVVFGSVLAFTSYTWLLRVDRPSRVGTYAFVNPVVAVALGWVVLDEPLTGRVVAAASAVIGAVVLINRARASKAETPSPPAADEPIIS